MKAQTVEQVLSAALWMIENVGWCQGTYTQTLFTGSVPIAFCALGALHQVEREDENLHHQAWCLLTNEASKLGYPCVAALNDSGTKELVVRAYHNAIKRAQQLEEMRSKSC